MKTINHNIKVDEFEKDVSWFLVALLMIFGWPIVKKVLIVVLEKLYELLIQHTGK